MKESSALCDFLTGNNLGSIGGIGFCYVTIGYFILAIFGYNVVVVNRILSGTDDDTCGNGIERFITSRKINSFVEKLFSCQGMILFAKG